MDNKLQLYYDPALKTFYDAIDKIRFYFNRMQIIVEGYRGYKIGNVIKVEFDDSFNTINFDMYIADILVNDKEDFGFILVPVKKDLEEGTLGLNPKIKEYGLADNAITPDGGCYFARYIGRERFSLEVDRAESKKKIGAFVIDVGYYYPKLFKIPQQTKTRLRDLFSILKDKESFPLEFRQITEGK